MHAQAGPLPRCLLPVAAGKRSQVLARAPAVHHQSCSPAAGCPSAPTSAPLTWVSRLCWLVFHFLAAVWCVARRRGSNAGRAKYGPAPVTVRKGGRTCLGTQPRATLVFPASRRLPPRPDSRSLASPVLGSAGRRSVDARRRVQRYVSCAHARVVPLFPSPLPA